METFLGGWIKTYKDDGGSCVLDKNVLFCTVTLMYHSKKKHIVVETNHFYKKKRERIEEKLGEVLFLLKTYEGHVKEEDLLCLLSTQPY